MAEPQTERRSSAKELVEIKDILGSLTAMLTLHMTKEETDIAELKDQMKDFFDDILPKTHIKHHEYVGKEIADEEKTNDFWWGVRKTLAEKLIIFAFGVLSAYFIPKWTETKPAHSPAPQEQRYERPALGLPPKQDSSKNNRNPYSD